MDTDGKLTLSEPLNMFKPIRGVGALQFQGLKPMAAFINALRVYWFNNGIAAYAHAEFEAYKTQSGLEQWNNSFCVIPKYLRVIAGL